MDVIRREMASAVTCFPSDSGQQADNVQPVVQEMYLGFRRSLQNGDRHGLLIGIVPPVTLWSTSPIRRSAEEKHDDCRARSPYL
jgi:hypothetical protein